MSRPTQELAADLPAFLSSLDHVAWLSRLGQPHPRDGYVKRIDSWRQWPGPERGYGEWFDRWPAVVEEAIQEDHSSRLPELRLLFQQVRDHVIGLVAPQVAEFDPREDFYHPPNSAVWGAAYTAALTAWHVALGRPIPDRLSAIWRWYADGHWPCDFAEEPPGFWDELQIDPPVGKLLVL